MYRIFVILVAAIFSFAGEAPKELSDVAVRLEPCETFPYVEPGPQEKYRSSGHLCSIYRRI